MICCIIPKFDAFCSICLTAPGDPPTFLRSSVINSTAVHLTWEQPLLPNGIIINYTVTYNLSELSVSAITDAQSILITGLEEYTVYEFEVFASTRIGPGPPASILARTDVASKVSTIVNNEN